MYSKIALESSRRVFHFLRLRSSVCIEDQNDSIIALSRPSPTLPKEGMSPAERIASPKAHEVNWTPWSAWTMPPGPGRRLRMAMSRALITKVVSWRESMDQPTIRRLKASTTAAQ